MNKVRFGIISTGMIADFHAKAILSDERAELIAVCGHTNVEKTRTFAQKYDIEKVYTDYRELAADKDIDAVCVCSPSGLHGLHGIQCLRNGKHVLCEKPLDIKGETMTEMIKVAEKNNRKLGCVFPNRTRHGLRKAKEIIDSGQLGKMTIVECEYRGYRSPEYYTSSNWKGTKELDGGGCLMNQGIHAIDTMCWLAGDVKTVYGVIDTMLRDIEVEDTAMAILEFENGARGMLMGTTISNVPEEAPEGDRLRIEFERGTIVYEKGKTSLYKREIKEGPDGFFLGDEVHRIPLDDEDKAVISSTSDPANLDMESHFAIVSNFISAVIDDTDPYITGSSARKSVDLVLALYKSSKSGMKVTL